VGRPAPAPLVAQALPPRQGPASPLAPPAGLSEADALDRQSPLPLWAQLLQDLRRRVAANEFGERLPPEGELAHAYGVSRHTVREALRRLEADGLVVRRQGLGTTLAPREFEQPLRGLYRLAQTFRSQGGSERSAVLFAGTVPASGRAELLGVRAGDPVVAIDRLRYAGGEPIALDRSWLPRAPGEALLRADLDSGSLYEALADRAGVRVTGGWERIFAVAPSAEDRRLLHLPRGQAVLAIERLALAGDRPVEFRESRIRGDRFCLRAEWREDA
jgi:GntR family transcriptional regulator